MSLTQLIEKYKGDLNFPIDSKPGEKYRDFSLELMQLPNYQYGLDQMKETEQFLLDNDFSIPARCAILENIARRKAMDKINDVERRIGIWDAIDVAFKDVASGKGYEGIEHLEQAIKYAGKEQVLTDLREMHLIYTKELFPQFDALKAKLRSEGDKSPEFRLLNQLYENHWQRTRHTEIVTRKFVDILEADK